MLNTFTTLSTIVADGGHEIVNELPVPAWVFGVAVFLILMFLLLATLSLKSVALRHDDPVSTDVDTTGGHGSHH